MDEKALLKFILDAQLIRKAIAVVVLLITLEHIVGLDWDVMS